VGVLLTRPGPFFSRSASTGLRSTSAGRPAPPDKQILREDESYGNSEDLNAIDPAFVAVPHDFDKAQLVFPPLITLGDAGNAVDWAASNHEISKDGLTYTFHLRPGMRWSDGAPIDATTFAYSINRALDPCLAAVVAASFLSNIKGAPAFSDTRTCKAGVNGLSADTLIGASIIVADPLTLKLILDKPAAYFLMVLSLPPSWAAPKRLIDQYGQTKWTDHLADGAGFGGNLYKVTKWDHLGHFALAANNAFWGQQPTIKKIEWTLYQTPDTAWEDYLAGIGDVAFPPAIDMQYARKLPGYAEIPTLSAGYLTVNWALPPFDDVRVRNAFSLAIDRRALATHVTNGAAAPTIHMIIDGIPGYNPNLTNAAGEGGDKALSANIPKARELAQSYAAEQCGGDYATCAPIVLPFAVDFPADFYLAQALQQEWQTAFRGWRISLQGASATLVQARTAAEQLTLSGWVADYPDPQDFTSLLWTKDSPANLSSVDVPEADALEQQADVSTDATGRLALYQRAEQLLINQGAFIAFQQGLFAWVVRPSSRLVKWNVNSRDSPSLTTWQQAYISV
jgi:peptide/nickel transport system substrate-binding protein/oligopeptide transport system substrate-binding protein